MNDNVIINQSFTPAELSGGSLHSLLYSRIGTVLIFAYCFVVLNFSLQALNPYAIYGEEVQADYVPLIAATVVPLLFIFNTKRQAVAALKKKGRYYKNITFTITPEFVKTEGEGYSNTYRWEEVVKVKEIKNWYLIFINKQQALLIRKSNIDQWQKDELDTVLRSVKGKTKVSLK